VGAVLASGLKSEMTSRAASAALQLPLPFRAPFVAALTKAAKAGIEAGAGATGATSLPSGLPSAVRVTLLNLGQSVFEHSFVLAMLPTILLSIAVLLAGALGCLFLGRPLRSVQATKTEEPISTHAASSRATSSPQRTDSPPGAGYFARAARPSSLMNARGFNPGLPARPAASARARSLQQLQWGARDTLRRLCQLRDVSLQRGDSDAARGVGAMIAQLQDLDDRISRICVQ
jgi:hypothetical protein